MPKLLLGELIDYRDYGSRTMIIENGDRIEDCVFNGVRLVFPVGVTEFTINNNRLFGLGVEAALTYFIGKGDGK